MIKTKTKICQNCKNKFTIEPEDFEFYKKIDVPAPTFCPECRFQRRFVYRNEGNGLHKRKDDISGKQIISIYNPKSPHKVCDYKYWWSDKWDSMDYGKDYDFDKPFFEQFKGLFRNIPHIGLYANDTTINCNSAIDAKDCYLTHQASYVENSAYCRRILHCKDCYDLYIVDKMELCYQDIYSFDSYKLFFSNHCHNCMESYFLYDCRNCQNCFGCVNLRNKKYHIFNKPYSNESSSSKIMS